MAKYKIKVHVELVECDDTINHEPTKNNDGSFSITISEQDAIRNGDEITSPTHLKNWLYLRVSFERQSLYSKFWNCFHQNIKKCEKS